MGCDGVVVMHCGVVYCAVRLVVVEYCNAVHCQVIKSRWKAGRCIASCYNMMFQEAVQHNVW